MHVKSSAFPKSERVASFSHSAIHSVCYMRSHRVHFRVEVQRRGVGQLDVAVAVGAPLVGESGRALPRFDPKVDVFVAGSLNVAVHKVGVRKVCWFTCVSVRVERVLQVFELGGRDFVVAQRLGHSEHGNKWTFTQQNLHLLDALVVHKCVVHIVGCPLRFALKGNAWQLFGERRVVRVSVVLGVQIDAIAF